MKDRLVINNSARKYVVVILREYDTVLLPLQRQCHRRAPGSRRNSMIRSVPFVGRDFVKPGSCNCTRSPTLNTVMMADSSRFGINLVYAVKIAGILRGHQLPNQPEYYLKVSAPMWRAVC
ncbi:uncharacterized protein LOC119768948 [Culex quinquefasciatus]|uniref:uncharacterized protein LOC119765917 n=1 Tax=Culex quinquefasciatus TaxID=7176 RepID=UPI0018E2C608|nr:uncharacterized protein LOC119765917 [Culex quinquefasciatus]XP_038106126.1 uncharacterized protein LOC119765927 [Culex quinquefasciatus]XP_038108593.1 uncharacterized protein LOC119766802 [Culex quinquefasciatus]XP_038116715.1 uncharacterized protein LOC119768948 [Culex quinquefasciatus]